LADLFYKITKEKKKVGTIAPKKFINRLKKEKGKNILYTCTCIHLSQDKTKLAIMFIPLPEEFDNYMQQDGKLNLVH
jgi:hypothetical protein